MTDTVQIPMGVTVEQMFNYLFHHIEQGREKSVVTLDQRGMTVDVSLLDMSDPAQLTLRYLGRFDVQLPREADYGYKLDYLMAVVEKLRSTKRALSI